MGTTRRKRRLRTAHPGVKLKRRSNGSWIARWTDPAGTNCQQSLDALGLASDEARRAWCIQRSKQLHAERAAIASGAAAPEKVAPADAVEDYLRAGAASADAKANTIASYRPALHRFQEWAGRTGVRMLHDLRAAHLAKYRGYLAQDRAAISVRSGRRGAKRQSQHPRARATVNRELGILKGLLNWSRKRGWTWSLSSDQIKDSLEPVKVPREAIAFLRPKELRALLAAALRHDAATFALTREEHDGKRPAGTTPRHEAIAPFVLAGILTGMRFGELAGLQWAEVDLEAQEIRLPAVRVKTAHARSIRLAESPAMLALLRGLRLRAAGNARVFPELGRDVCKKARARLVARFGAPRTFTWQALRASCGSILTNAPGIYGAASAFMSAKRLGHSVTIAERHYVGVLPELPRDAKTIEAAAGIEDLAQKVVECAGGKPVAEAAVAQ